ncbi:rho GTPase-activating protein 15-like [Xenopus laevis]|uniref:Rho GTPase-activating protein 15 n=1 Tax=Xenopus laevis TaxID=8355 RepID=A0A8J1LX02_XENLA|nr:rho GTPase-activating protein 15-like [Xenopus laevis]
MRQMRCCLAASFPRKNWVASYTVLSGPKLEFYKDTKDQVASNFKSSIKPECIDLCGASIEWTNEKSNRKNVFQITTLSGNEFLFQSDADITVQEWFSAIRNTIDSLPQEGFWQNGLILIDYRPQQRPRYVCEQLAFANMRSVYQVFGCQLETLCKRKNTMVQNFVKQCIEAVEKRGMDADGIYRVSGNLSTIQKLLFIVNQEEKLNLDDSQWDDIHVVTGALKMFFRELPEPLFPYRFFEKFVEAIKLQESDLHVKAIRELVWTLPPANCNTMKTLFEHLRKIVINASVNLMSTQSLGIVFGQTLLRLESDMGNMAVCMVYQNQIVELMLTEFDKIFS